MPQHYVTPMAYRSPGTPLWWRDTALIVASGIALAVWLWDEPIFAARQAPAASAPAELTTPTPQTMADLFEAGCITAEHLQAMREGRSADVLCYFDTPAPATPNAPPQDRLFP